MFYTDYSMKNTSEDIHNSTEVPRLVDEVEPITGKPESYVEGWIASIL